MKILMIGAGEIAREYIKTLLLLGYKDVDVLSRSQGSADRLAAEYGLKRAYAGGEETLKRILKDYDAFIIGTTIESLMLYLDLLAGEEHVLVEKPVTLSGKELKEFLDKAPDTKAKVALNRCFFPSVLRLADILEKEEVTSAEFSFTEWIHRIDTSKFSAKELRYWGLSNCIHVISTVFRLIGLPERMACFRSGEGVISWHPSASVFQGSGVSRQGVPFSYASDWRSAGRWSITIKTTRGSYHLAPMEGVNFCPKGTIELESLIEPYSDEFKCGFPEMLSAWLNKESNCISLPELVPYIESIEEIFGYDS